MFNYAGLQQETNPFAGIGAGAAARLSLKSAGIDVDDPSGLETLTAQVMENLANQGYEGVDPKFVRQLAAKSLAMGGLVQKADDPVILPQPYVAPTDFAAQYPQPLDPTEILTLCEEITTWPSSGSLLQ